MNVINVTLIAVATMLGVALLTLPLIFAFKGWHAWQAIPKDVYTRERMTLFRMRPITIWFFISMVGFLGNVCQWLHWSRAYTIIDGLTLGMLAIFLTAHLIWSSRLLRRRDEIDNRLRLFARYAIVGTSAGLLVLVLGLLSKYVAT